MLFAKEGLATPAGGASPNAKRLASDKRHFISTASRETQAKSFGPLGKIGTFVAGVAAS
jgi:hypothetical protein